VNWPPAGAVPGADSGVGVDPVTGPPAG
jgi:hypothetical protein